MDEQLHKLLTSVFLPTIAEAVERFDQGVRLAHYTTYETALKIIEGRVVWMRDARQMNDIGEIQHGIDALTSFMADDVNFDRVQTVLKPFGDPTLALLMRQYAAQLRALVANGQVFITCVSEHWPKEDGFGRLSMWRAYCAKPDGVAIVMRTEPFRLQSNALNAYSSPVFYGDQAAFAGQFHQILDAIEREQSSLRLLPPQGLMSAMQMAMLFAAVCLKHPGFAEEEEWRVIHIPSIPLPSKLRRRALTGEAPQVIFEIPLEDAPEVGLVGLEPDALIERVIIGPTARASEIRSGLIAAMEAVGVKNAGARIDTSGIPLRV